MKRVELISALYRRKWLCTLLKTVGNASVFLCAAALFAVMLRRLLAGDYYAPIYAAITLGVPFIAVSVLRKLLSFPRPYELYDFGARIKHGGGSFPSRHAYSAFAIGSYLCFLEPPLGITVLALGALISAIRVLMGLHFLRDVIAGAAIGILSSLIGGFIFLY